MRKLVLLFSITFILIVLYPQSSIFGQNAVIGSGFTSGWGSGCGSNYQYAYLGTSAGTTYIRTSAANGTGDQYWRFGVDWGGTVTQLTITPGTDTRITMGTKYSLNMSCTTSGALVYNVGSSSYNYVFKTLNAGSAPTGTFVVLEVQGAIQTFSSTTPPTSVDPGSTQRIYVTMSGTFSAGQGAYLRYTNNGWTSSTVAAMTYSGSSNIYYADIPAASNVAGTAVAYYFFTSGSGLTIAGSDADLYTINMLNNGGANYTYTPNTTLTTKADGNWNSTGTWTSGVVPASNSSITINNNVTLNQDATVSAIAVASGKTLTINSGNTLQSNGAITVTGAISCSGTIQLNSGATVVTNSPSYLSGSTLTYNLGGGSGAKVNQALEWPSTNPPSNINILNGTWVQLQGDRSISGNLTVTNGALQAYGGSLRTLTMNGTTQTITISTTTGGAIYGVDNGVGNDLKLQINSTSTTTLTGDATTSSDDEKKFFQINVDGKLALSRGILCKYGTFTAAGTIQINNNGYIQATNGAVVSYSGTGSSLIYSNGGPYTSTDWEWPTSNSPYNVSIQAAGTNVTLNDSKSISGTLTLSAGNITLGANNLTLGGSFPGSASAYVVTNSTGCLIANVGSTGVTFPIGIATSDYTPITFSNAGTAQNYNVRVISATAPTGGLARQWVIKETSANHTSFGTMTLAWNAGDKGNLPTSGTCDLVSNTSGSTVSYDLLKSGITMSGSDPYSMTASTFAKEPGDITGGLYVSVVQSDAALPVELSSFSSEVDGRNVKLNWETITEKNSNVFVIEKAVISNNDNSLNVNNQTNWLTAGIVKAADLSNTARTYSYTDKNLEPGKYDYRIRMIDNDGTFELSKTVESEITVPANFALNQNYPNPFNPTTKISYQLPSDSKVTLEVFSVTGERVAQLVNGVQAAGYYSIDFGITRLISSGIYYYRMNATDNATGNIYSSVKKMMLIK